MTLIYIMFLKKKKKKLMNGNRAQDTGYPGRERDSIWQVRGGFLK